jgi:hypothetical protein
MTKPINVASKGNMSPIELLKQWDNSTTENHEELEEYNPLEDQVYHPPTIAPPLSLPKTSIHQKEEEEDSEATVNENEVFPEPKELSAMNLLLSLRGTPETIEQQPLLTSSSIETLKVLHFNLGRSCLYKSRFGIITN